MTPEEQEMREIVESVDGGCWHIFNDGYMALCEKCNASYSRGFRNPSPTDMNVLMEYARKLCSTVILHIDDKCEAVVWMHLKGLTKVTDQDTPADALREALYQAVKGEG